MNRRIAVVATISISLIAAQAGAQEDAMAVAREMGLCENRGGLASAKFTDENTLEYRCRKAGVGNNAGAIAAIGGLLLLGAAGLGGGDSGGGSSSGNGGGGGSTPGT